MGRTQRRSKVWQSFDASAKHRSNCSRKGRKFQRMEHFEQALSVGCLIAARCSQKVYVAFSYERICRFTQTGVLA
uniref:MADS-box domain-containing protein n=1 Tax=Ascaris lumbricoides TaxID=6252 RepID=A0A0M3HUZ3_ASCLU